MNTIYTYSCLVLLPLLLLPLLILLLKSRSRCCDCSICRAYVTSSWTSDYRNLCDWLTDLLRQSPTRTIHIHVLNNTITANPENVEHILKKNFQNYPKGKPFCTILGDLLGHGIFNVDGEHWLFQRKLAATEMFSATVRDFTSNVVSSEIKHHLLPLLDEKQGQVVDLQQVFRKFAFDVMCKVSFGLDSCCLESSLSASEFADAFDTATVMSARRGAAVFTFIWKMKRMFNIGSEKELKMALQIVNSLADEVIFQRRKLGFSSKDDLLSHFMGSVQDDKYLRDIVISFMLAGRDTVASSLTLFFFLLSKNPTVRNSIREEIEKIGLCEKLGDMHYVHAAIYESMRLYPPVQFDSKFSLENDTLPDGTYVTEGTRVTYHCYAMGRMEEIWSKEWYEFRPQRWLREDGTYHFAQQSSFKSPIFHAGPRECIGKDMALREMKAVVAEIVAKYDIQVLEGVFPKFGHGLTASLVGGLPVRVQRREIKESRSR